MAKVEKNPLKQVARIENAIAATLDHLNFVVQALDKTTGRMVHEIVQNFFRVLLEGLQEPIKTVQTTAFDQRDPASDLKPGAALGHRTVEHIGQYDAQTPGHFQPR